MNERGQPHHELARRGKLESAERTDDATLLEMGRRVLREEAQGIARVADELDESFAASVRWCYACAGRILVSGLGKSGLVARKIAATLTSTGTPALFVHPVEALHGDLGIATGDDLLLLISRSGANQEILTLQGSLKSLGVRSIAITTRRDSRLATACDLSLVTSVPREACPLDLTPTTSATAALALGDALAMTLLELREFKPEDFAVFHPSGDLGRTLRMTVRELMHSGEAMPSVGVSASLREALVEVAAKRLGCTCVVEDDGRLAGFLTDGDLKRILLRDAAPLDRPVEETMTRTPKSVQADCLARAALSSMENNPGGAISQLVVVDAGRPIGVVHLHDILRMGLGS